MGGEIEKEPAGLSPASLYNLGYMGTLLEPLRTSWSSERQASSTSSMGGHQGDLGPICQLLLPGPENGLLTRMAWDPEALGGTWATCECPLGFHQAQIVRYLQNHGAHFV